MNDLPTQPAIEALPAHEATVGSGMQVRRALPHRLRRHVGAWCFLDHYGPVTLAAQDAGMRVGPHPHMGLQTVSWLYEGAVLHRDSLGSLQLIEPGQLNLMTAGEGISHAEESPARHPPDLHGLQFWIALPESRRHGEAAFDHHPKLPQISRDGLAMTLHHRWRRSGERSPRQGVFGHGRSRHRPRADAAVAHAVRRWTLHSSTCRVPDRRRDDP